MANAIVARLQLIVVGSIRRILHPGVRPQASAVAAVLLYAYVNLFVAAVILGTLLLREPFIVRMALAAALTSAGAGLVRSSRLAFEW